MNDFSVACIVWYHFTHSRTSKIGVSSLKPCVLSSSAVAAAESLQSCPTLCNPTDGSTPGSPVPGILQAKTLEWVAIAFSNACTHAKSLQLCPTLCDPMDSSPPGSSVHRILQARVLEWVAISFFRGSGDQSHPTLWTVACQAPLSMGFSRWEYWSGLSFPLQGISPAPGSNSPLLRLPHWQVDSLPLCHLGSPSHCPAGFTSLCMLWIPCCHF